MATKEKEQSDTESTGPDEGFVKAVAFIIVAAYIYRRWF